MRRIATLFLCVFFLDVSFAQTKGVQLIFDCENGEHHLINLGKEGVFLLKKGGVITGTTYRTWDFSYFDTDFHKIWESEVSADSVLNLTAFQYDNVDTPARLFVFFTHPVLVRKEFLVFDFSVRSVLRKTFDTPVRFNTHFFRIHNDALYMAGEKNGHAVAGHYDMKKATFTPIPIDKKHTLFYMYPPGREDIIQLISLNTKGKNKGVYINLFKKSDNTTSASLYLKEPEDKRFLNTVINDFGHEKLILGNYSAQDASRGLYISKATGNMTNHIKYYPFEDFKNFSRFAENYHDGEAKHGHNSPRRKRNMPESGYWVYLHPLVQQGDQYILVGEAYYPTYVPKSLTATIGEHSATKIIQSFDGYKSTHALVAGFDKEGKLLWSDCFPMSLTKRFFFSNMVHVDRSGDLIKLIYVHQNSLFIKIIKNNSVVDDVGENCIAKQVPISTDMKHGGNFIVHWHHNNFLAWSSWLLDAEENKRGERKRVALRCEKIEY